MELNEAIIVEEAAIIRLYYRYHFQDEKNCLVFRYDNAPHFPTLSDSDIETHLTCYPSPCFVNVGTGEDCAIKKLALLIKELSCYKQDPHGDSETLIDAKPDPKK